MEQTYATRHQTVLSLKSQLKEIVSAFFEKRSLVLWSTREALKCYMFVIARNLCVVYMHG